ncbi:MAG: bifunctional hydroxymethylpyrimidine kinase/phosphomethylpyrimidine kinase [Oligoflexia bacterium]|nr:bifunctional hydroxymethylpyrimidine kinase/phosphomethylpyrimidine kinase [Oligoflexia bacterium]
MLSRKADLIKILNKIRGLPILVVGDLMLDRYIWGAVERISPEAPVPVVRVNRVEDRLGGAGNVARNLARLGAQVHVAGLVGADEEGLTLLKIAERDGMNTRAILRDRSTPTTLKTRVIAHAQQVVRIDREEIGNSAKRMQRELVKLVRAALPKMRALIVSDYGKGAIGQELMLFLAEAKERGQLGMRARPYLLDPNPVNYEIYREVGVVKPNRKEAEEASGIKITDRATALKAARRLIENWQAEMVLLTLGERGLMIAPRGKRVEPIYLDTVAQEVHDVSGAGDTVTALFAAALSAGATPAQAGDLANIGAGIVVSEVGTVAIDPKKLISEIERLSAGRGSK